MAFNWWHVARFVGALGMAVGSHFIAPDAVTAAIGDAIAVVIAQGNRPLTDKRK